MANKYKCPRVGDVVKSRVTTESLAGYVVAKEGLYVWVRFFDTKFEDGDFWDVYSRRDTLEVVSSANNR